MTMLFEGAFVCAECGKTFPNNRGAIVRDQSGEHVLHSPECQGAWQRRQAKSPAGAVNDEAPAG
jgi:hypothetical protein